MGFFEMMIKPFLVVFVPSMYVEGIIWCCSKAEDLFLRHRVKNNRGHSNHFLFLRMAYVDTLIWPSQLFYPGFRAYKDCKSTNYLKALPNSFLHCQQWKGRVSTKNDSKVQLENSSLICPTNSKAKGPTLTDIICLNVRLFWINIKYVVTNYSFCLLYTSPSPRD